MKRNFMPLAALALALFLQFFTTQSNAQTDGTGIIVRVMIDGKATDYYNGVCGYGTAAWGGAFTDDFCASPAWGYDITPDSLGCDSIPVGQLDGKIALIRRGVCGFSIKAYNAQQAGAVAVLVVHTATGNDDCYVQGMGATQPQAGLTTIPVLFACRNLGNQIDAALKAGKSVQVCFVKPDIDITDYFYPASHTQQPDHQIKTDTFGFSALVSNPSATTARTNVVVTAKVKTTAGADLYTTSFTVPELSPGVVDSFIELPGKYAPELPIGSYQVLYTTKADSIDAAPIADRASGNFYVTQNLVANDFSATNGYRPGTAGDWAVGSVYSLSPKTIEQYQVKTMEMNFATNAADYPLTNVTSTIYFFKAKPDLLDDWSNFDDTQLLSESLEWLGLAAYTAPSTLTTNYTLQQVDISDLVSGNVGIKLDPGVRYMLVVSYTAPTNLTFHGFDEKVDLPGVSTTIFRDTWFLGGFGAGLEAISRIYLDLVIKTDEKPLPETSMKVAPNPVQDNLNLALQFDHAVDATITIADINGRVITYENREGLTNETLTYALPQLASGTYLARIATKEGTLTKKFVVQK